MNAIADRLEIIELLGRHQITIDLGDAELYAPDGRYESPFATARGRGRRSRRCPLGWPTPASPRASGT